MKILVVDDSNLIRTLVKSMLKVKNYEVDTADNGAQALDKYFKVQPDLVILDLSMPVMDGHETLTRLLRQDANAKVIMFSALESEELLARCLQKGAIGYLTKPCSKEDLFNIIERSSSGTYDKNVTTFLSQACKLIESSIRKISEINISVILENVQIRRKKAPLSYKTDKIVSVPEISQDEFEIKMPPATSGYISEIGGRYAMTLVTFVPNDDPTLFAHYIKEGDDTMEFFNIVNSKICSTLANATQLILDIKPVRLYDHEKDKKVFGNEIIQAHLKFVTNNTSIPLEVQLSLNSELVFGKRF